ncbi:MAG TPA: SRPBCC family protein [Actinocatenispora sp.]
MELTNTFTVPAPVDEAWARLLDLPAVAPCLPGATLTDSDGDSFTGTVKVKLGPISLTYKGSGRIAERDDAAHRVVVEASGRETRGPGTATATITATLVPDGDGTRVDVVTDLTVTGRPAQFGRSMLADVSARLLDQFAACVADQLRPAPAAATTTDPGHGTDTVGAVVADAGPGAASTAAPATQHVPDEAAPIDLFEVTGARQLVRRAIPYVAAFAVGALVAAAVARLRRRDRAT